MGKKQIIIDNDTQEVYEGVTYFENGRVSHGDRDDQIDATFAEMRRRINNAPKSAKRGPAVRDFQKEREAREWPETKERLVKSHGERAAAEYHDKHFNNGQEADRKARKLAEVRQAQSMRGIDSFSCPTADYVAPHETPTNPAAWAALTIALLVLLIAAIGGG